MSHSFWTEVGDSEVTRVMGQGLREGFWPFRPALKEVIWATDQDIERNWTWIVVEAVFHDRSVMAHKVPVRRAELVGNPDWYYPVANQIMLAFRNRVADPIPGNIKLGEN